MANGILRVLACVFGAVLLVITASAGAADIFLKLEGIPGDSTNEAHKDEIEVISFSLGFSNDVRLGSARSPGECGDLTLTKTIDRSSPRLLAAVMTGRHMSKGVLSFTASVGEQPADYYVLNLSEILVTGLRQADSNGATRVSEQVTLSARGYEFVFRTQQANGTFIEQKFNWDCVRNSGG
jgi:type VI secretion system secreted protein Hcp